MNELITDYFAAEEAIEARLMELVPTAKILFPGNLADMVESSQHSPAIHVVYSGDSVPGDNDGRSGAQVPQVGQGALGVVDQRWLVVVAVRHPKGQLQDTRALRTLAGPMVVDVLKALKGWAPAEWMRPLRRVSGAPPAYYTSSFAYFPFMFAGRILI